MSLEKHSTGFGFNFLRRKTKTSTRDAAEDSRSSTSSTRSDHGTHFSDPADPDNTMIGADTTNGKAGISDSEYARKRRELLTIARDLGTLGATEELDVPCIVVIGAQSAGKSSLVEAVTGINVPRDAGTCTRCPMECAIFTSATRWSCIISIQARESKEKVAFSPMITSKQEVELWIRRAQAAVLCPHLPAGTFKNKSKDELKQLTDSSKDSKVLKFTDSVVSIVIEDPEGVDLVFVDLPGLVQNEDEHVIKVVKDLVVKYISPPSTVILVTVPASDDMENQQAMKLAKEADPDGERTIAVITKPDAMGSGASGSRKKWQEIFEGRVDKHRLKLGYYCVRLPDDDERKKNLPPKEAEQISMRFFRTTAPWKDLQADSQTRLGVRNLVRDVSQLLLRLLLEALPKFKEGVNRLIQDCLLKLHGLPRPPAQDATSEVVRLIVNFCRDMVDTVYGRNEDKSFVHRSREVYRTLRLDIRRTAPDFRPFEHPDQYVKPSEPQSQREDDERSNRVDYMFLIPDDPEDSIATEIWNDTATRGTMGLRDVNLIIKQCTGWELPHSPPYEAKIRLIKRFVSSWPTPSKRCFGSIENIINEIVNDKVKEQFGRFPGLEKHLIPLLHTQIAVYVERSVKSLEDVLTREELPYWTQNGHYYDSTRDLWLMHYKSVRSRRDDYRHGGSSRATSLSAHVEPGMHTNIGILQRQQYEAQALAALHALGYLNTTVQDFPRLIAADEYNEEITLMADVRSYFQVAYKRVVDNVPMTIHHDLVIGFADSLQAYLLEKLLLGSPDASKRLQLLQAEHPEITQERSRLQSRKKTLEDIKARLDNFRL